MTYVICWDLDLTILDDDGENPKPGIEELLQELADQGFVHYITTSGSTERARNNLQAAGLESYFKKVYGQKEVSWQGRKFYEKIMSEEKMDEEQAKSNMLVIGDGLWDISQDLQCVFFQQEEGYRIDSSITRTIINTLLNRGDGDFTKGFESLLNDADAKWEFSFDDFKVRLSYKNFKRYDNDKPNTVPKIYMNISDVFSQ